MRKMVDGHVGAVETHEHEPGTVPQADGADREYDDVDTDVADHMDDIDTDIAAEIDAEDSAL